MAGGSSFQSSSPLGSSKLDLPEPRAATTEDTQPKGGFLNHPWVQNVLPVATSLATHAGIAILAAALITAAGTVAKVEKPEVPQQTEIPVAPTIHETPATALPNFGGPELLPKEPRQDKIELPPVVGTAQTAGPDVKASPSGGGDGGVSSATSLLGRGNSGAPGSGGPGGLGDGIDSGIGGKPAKYGRPSLGGGDGPTIFPPPPGRQPRKIVFVCDATGTMIQKMSVLKRELVRTVGSLKTGTQSYKIIFYTDAGAVVTEKRDGLIVCSPNSRKATFDWLADITPMGTTDPIPALQAAFALKPDLIYFLSDGEFNNLRSYENVQEEITRLHAAHGGQTKVNTILFETFDPSAEKVMQTISSHTGGIFTRIGLKDLEASD